MVQTNLGYNHIGKTLEILNIELGSLYERHAKAMDKKVFYDKQQKEKRNSREGITSYLNKKKTSQTLRREVSEGVTYESSAGLNLDPTNHQTVSEMPTEISLTELKG